MKKSSHAQDCAATFPKRVPAECGLWRGHPATRAQQSLPFTSANKRPRRTQADVVIEKLRECRTLGVPLRLPEILKMGIGQHSARFNEIRARGYVVTNTMVRVDGVVRSEYRLTGDPERDPAVQT